LGDRFSHLVQRITDYPWWEISIELTVLWLVVYSAYRFVRGTRAAGALKGLLFLLIIGTLVFRFFGDQQFPRLTALYSKFITIALIALVVTFQPELRRALIRLGETPFFRTSGSEVRRTVEAIVSAAEFLSKNKFGAIMAIERNIGLRDAIETGQPVNADVSAPLLESIFWPNSPLHDMAVVIRGQKIIAAGVQFPLADPADVPDAMLGTRHRAALGMARVSDALVVVVSEETGAISLAEGTQMTRWLTPEQLRAELMRRLSRNSGGTPRPNADEPAGTPPPEVTRWREKKLA
jgi:diadenylate cyclase